MSYIELYINIIQTEMFNIRKKRVYLIYLFLF